MPIHKGRRIGITSHIGRIGKHWVVVIIAQCDICLTYISSFNGRIINNHAKPFYIVGQGLAFLISPYNTIAKITTKTIYTRAIPLGQVSHYRGTCHFYCRMIQIQASTIIQSFIIGNQTVINNRRPLCKYTPSVSSLVVAYLTVTQNTVCTQVSACTVTLHIAVLKSETIPNSFLIEIKWLI